MIHLKVELAVGKYEFGLSIINIWKFGYDSSRGFIYVNIGPLSIRFADRDVLHEVWMEEMTSMQLSNFTDDEVVSQDDITEAQRRLKGELC